MDRNRVLELALEGLEKQKSAVDAEIDDILAELRGVPQKSKMIAIVTDGRRVKTPAQKKAQSLKMKKIWAARKRRTVMAEKPISSKAKRDGTAKSKAMSVAIKKAWAKRKAKESASAKNQKPAEISTKE